MVLHAYRIVADEQRTLALGFQSVIWRLFGAIGSLIAGSVFDASCEYWQYECGERGNCWVYDNQTLSYRVVGLESIIMTTALAFFILTWLTYPKNQVQEDALHKDSKGDVTISATNVVTLDEIQEKESSPPGKENVPEGAQVAKQDGPPNTA